MSGTGQGASFAIADVRSKRPFVNECKGVLCGAVHQKALGFDTLSVNGEFSQTIARACYIRYPGALG